MKKLKYIILFIYLFAGGKIFSATSITNFCATPPFITAQVEPNVLFILDNSGSMNNFAYRETQGTVYVYYYKYWWSYKYNVWTGYEPGKKYYGIFNPDKCYKYDNVHHYFYEVGDTVDDPSTPNIHERAACLASSCTTRCFSGNWLNWFTMRRIDVAKKVLTGGKLGQDPGELTLVGTMTDRDQYRIFNDYASNDSPTDGSIVPLNKNVYYTPFRRGFFSIFININRYGQYVPAFSVISAKFVNNSAANITQQYYGIFNSQDILSNKSEYGNLGETALAYSPYFVAVKINYTPNGVIQKVSEKMRVGYMHFNYSQGGKIENYVGDDPNTIITKINNTLGQTWTPLSETLYEAVRYFKQENPFYFSTDYSVNKTWDPYYYNDIGQYVPCAKSFIVLVTDGEPTMDTNIPSTMKMNFYGNGGVGDGKYLDDIAYYMHTHDLRPDLDGEQTITLYTVFAFGDPNSIGINELKRAARAGGFTDKDGDNQPYCDEKCTIDWGYNFYPGSCGEGPEKCAKGCEEWDTNCDGIPDNFYYASNGDELEQNLIQIFADISKKPASGTSLGISFATGKNERADGVIQAVFYPQNIFEEGTNSYKVYWIGDLYKYSPKKVESGFEKWKAGEKLAKETYTQRKVYISDGNNLEVLNPFSIPSNIQDLTCGTDSTCKSNIQNIFEFILGKQIANKRNITINSAGETWKLGDIIYSTPQVEYYENLNKSYIFVGANDGMLHVFDYQTGDEVWSFIPKNALPYLKYYYEKDYETCHLYYVDAEPYIITANGKKILIGGMGWGGATGCSSSTNCVNPPSETCANINTDCNGLSSYFALDITDINHPILLWEFSDPNLGFTWSGPGIVKRINGTTTNYYVVFASGPTSYNGYSTQNLYLYVLDLFTGKVLLKTDNFDGKILSNAFGGRIYNEGLDVNEDNQTDYIFVGYTTKPDPSSYSKGGVLKIWTGDINPSNWDFDTNFFKFVKNPVSAKIEYMKCFDKWYIFLGTGRYFYNGDDDQDINYLYGIPFPCNENNICIPSYINSTFIGGSEDLCNNVGNFNSLNQGGWSIKLEGDTSSSLKERCYSDPLVVKDKNLVYFFTGIPTGNICEFGGKTKIYGLNCATGEFIDNQTCTKFKTSPPTRSKLVIPTTIAKIYSFTPDLKPINFTPISGGNGTPPVVIGLPPPGGGGYFLPKIKGRILLWLEK